MRKTHVHVPRGTKVTESVSAVTRVFYTLAAIVLALIAASSLAAGETGLAIFTGVLSLGGFAAASEKTRTLK